MDDAQSSQPGPRPRRGRSGRYPADMKETPGLMVRLIVTANVSSSVAGDGSGAANTSIDSDTPVNAHVLICRSIDAVDFIDACIDGGVRVDGGVSVDDGVRIAGAIFVDDGVCVDGGAFVYGGVFVDDGVRIDGGIFVDGDVFVDVNGCAGSCVKGARSAWDDVC